MHPCSQEGQWYAELLFPEKSVVSKQKEGYSFLSAGGARSGIW